MEGVKAALGYVVSVKDVPSAGLTRLLVELPIEAHVEATRLFYGQRVLVTITALDGPLGILEAGGGAQVSAPAAPLQAGQKAGPLCMSAVRLGNTADFQRFLACQGWSQRDGTTPDEARAAILEICGVESRKQLDEQEEARQSFSKLMEAYRTWRQDSGLGA